MLYSKEHYFHFNHASFNYKRGQFTKIKQFKPIIMVTSLIASIRF